MNPNINGYWNGKDAIAFDVSTRSTGWAMWTGNQLHSGVIQPPAENNLLWERTRYIHNEVDTLLFGEQSIDWHVFLEDVIPKGMKMCAMLSEARSAVITAIPSIYCLQNISPSTWKGYFKCATGDSANDKAAAHAMMCRLWNKDFPITMLGKEKTYDQTDAVAVLTYALYTRKYEEDK